MKKGFALLETLIVITFLSVSLLLLYSTFTNMIDNSRKNILYDDVSNIYKAYYTKEYLKLGELTNIETDNIKELTCSDFTISGCKNILTKFKVNKMYIAKIDLKTPDKINISDNLRGYLDTLSNKSNDKYRLILEFKNGEKYSYSSISINEVNYE